MGKSSGGGDPVGAAQAQGAADRETARDVTYADRPDQYNPFGSLTWGQEEGIDPATGEKVTRWQQNTNLSPDMQNVDDSQMSQILSRGDLSSALMDRVWDETAEAPNWEQFGEGQSLQYDPNELRQRAEDAAYKRNTMRLDPQYESRQAQLETQLANQGLSAGDRAYDSAMQSFGNERTDAYERARLGSVGEGRAEASQLFGQQTKATDMANALRDSNIQEYIGKRGYSLAEAERIDPQSKLSELSKIIS